MESTNWGSSRIGESRSTSSQLLRAPSPVPQLGSDGTVSVPRNVKSIATAAVGKRRKLIADQQYFGLEAAAFRAGAERALARLSRQPPERARIDARSLGDEFRLDAAASAALLSALLAGGLLYPDGSGQYRPTRLFREYALALVVAPLSRERAKMLIDRACVLIADINADWDKLPFQIELMAVSGSYMTRREQLAELSLSLVLCPRPESRKPRSGPMLAKEGGLRQVLDAIRALSSFIAVRVVVDRNAVQRPFSVAFEIGENVVDHSAGGWNRFRDWTASVTRWLAVK